MEGIANNRVLFVAGFGPIVREAAASRKPYGQTLGIPFKEETGGYQSFSGWLQLVSM